MSKLLYCLTMAIVPCLLGAGEPQKDVRYTNLVWILDRHVYGGKVLAGRLHAIMGTFDACMLTCAKAIFDRVPVLVSAPVVDNLLVVTQYGIKGHRPEANKKTLKAELTKIFGKNKKNVAADTRSEIGYAQQYISGSVTRLEWLKSDRLRDFMAQKFSRCLKNKTYIYYSKNPNLQLVLILPKQEGITQEQALRAEGFNEEEFTTVPLEKIDADKGIASQDLLEYAGKPLDISAFKKLFIADHALRRNIYLLGHGNDGVIAQLETARFKQCISDFAEVGCTSLAICSCYAGSRGNLEVYKDAKFLVIVFSVGDMVAYADISFGQKVPSQNFDSYFKRLRVYLQNGQPADPYPQKEPKAVNDLCEALAALHVNRANNYPWIYFPGSSDLVHMSLLNGSIKDVEAKAVEAVMTSESQSEAVQVGVVPVPPAISPTTISPDSGIISEETLLLQRPLEFDNKKDLLLHAQHVSVPVRFSKSIPRIISMAHKISFHCFEFLDIGHLYFKELLYKLAESKKSFVIKQLECVNCQSLYVAEGWTGFPLTIDHMIITPVIDAQKRNIMLQLLFKVRTGGWNQVYALLNDGQIVENNIMNLDIKQEDIRARHTYETQNLIKSTSDAVLRTSLQQMIQDPIKEGFNAPQRRYAPDDPDDFDYEPSAKMRHEESW